MPTFLYEQLDGARKMRMPLPEVPKYVTDNLNPDFVMREYQQEAFGRFFHCYGNEYEGKKYPLHFLFNMATGSGKTLIMAGLMLYLYKQGYRNFLFFACHLFLKFYRLNRKFHHHYCSLLQFPAKLSHQIKYFFPSAGFPWSVGK